MYQAGYYEVLIIRNESEESSLMTVSCIWSCINEAKSTLDNIIIFILC